jgi:LacI family transcriptional regulator
VLDELPVIHRPLRGTVQGLITIDAYSATALSEMVRSGVPVVALDFHTHGAAFDSVCFDHLQAGFLATEHLRRLGHKQVAFLGDRPNEKGTDPAWQDRLKGYLYAMSCSDPEKGSTWVLDIGRGDYFIRSKLPDFHARHNPTAYVLASSRLAPAVLSMLTELGLRCPEDVSLACADSSLPHIEREGATNLQLSCARNSFRELGCMAVRLLASRLSSPAMPPLNVTLPVSFQSGGTSQPLRH